MCTLLMLVGVPGSGKTTWAKKNLGSQIIVSRDDIVVSEGQKIREDMRYIEAWESVDQMRVTSIYRGLIKLYASQRVDFTIDATNLTRIGRGSILTDVASEYQDYTKVAMIFPHDDMEGIWCRLENRAKQGDKVILRNVFDDMIVRYEPPSLEEGFSQIIKI